MGPVDLFATNVGMKLGFDEGYIDSATAMHDKLKEVERNLTQKMEAMESRILGEDDLSGSFNSKSFTNGGSSMRSSSKKADSFFLERRLNFHYMWFYSIGRSPEL